MKLLGFIANQPALLTLIDALAACSRPRYSWCLRTVCLVFAATIFALGVVLDTTELRNSRLRPTDIVLGAITSYSVCQLPDFAAAVLGRLHPETMLPGTQLPCGASIAAGAGSYLQRHRLYA